MAADTKTHLKLAEDDSQGGLGQTVERIAAELAGEGAFSAPVHLPPKDQLAVRLVNLNVLQHLDEAQSDTNIFQNMFWGVFGVTFGLAASVVAAPGGVALAGSATFVALGGLLTASVGVGGLWFRYSRRAKALKDKIWKGATFNDIAS